MLAYRERKEGKPGPQNNSQFRPAAVSWDEVTGRFARHAPHRLSATITCRKYSDCRGQEPLSGRAQVTCPQASSRGGGGENEGRVGAGMAAEESGVQCPGSREIAGHVITRRKQPREAKEDAG